MHAHPQITVQLTISINYISPNQWLKIADLKSPSNFSILILILKKKKKGNTRQHIYILEDSEVRKEKYQGPVVIIKQ
jgi:hypothetical protein